MRAEVTPLGSGGDLLGRCMREISWVMIIFYILTGIWVTQVQFGLHKVYVNAHTLCAQTSTNMLISFVNVIA